MIALVTKIPFVFKPKFKNELQRMVNLDIIQPVEKPIDWVNSFKTKKLALVILKPIGGIQIFLHPRPLNKAIK